MANSKINKIVAFLNDLKQETEEAKPKAVEAEVKETAVELAEAMIEGVKIEAEEFAVGEAVFAVSEEGERIPLTEGSYKTDEGNMFTVDENGVIASIGEPAMEEETEAEEEQEMSEESKEPKKVVETESVSRETFFSAIDELKAEIASLKETHKEELSKKDKELEAVKAELSATPSEKATKAAPTTTESPVAKWERAAGVGVTTKDRVLSQLSRIGSK